ncbi:Na/Pi cotransporter family protein [Bosea sp. PAMC 26642]|uniref:Na/Pi cotransporter family protein n=1 Tax=Bosea sp. (strain PAMC 26642) TaxID=1792307 RepID=UPI0007701DC5|nr:Na/Pi symporter [Bosea sp. PAMC 26642]AMJ60661.1 Na/Pi-cotransporter II-related protein [Bosea sp. PAMC 26642]
MQIDIFTQVIVPVIGGLGIFMLGLEFMSNGIQNLAVNKMRALLAKIAGTPVKGVLAGTFITGIIQSSTAMTVMVVGLVNAGVIGLRPAISVIMGANIGTTLGNGLIALPLGPLGLFLAGIFALVHIFAKSEKVKNISLACMGFALIFYGLNLMTGGLRPLRAMPEVMGVISSLKADGYLGLLYCVLIAAGITAMIHSSSATIGIVMGLGAAGILDWKTAVAFSLGADLGTTITSWMASLNLTKNAKRAAYFHISFNIIGVAITIPLFFVSMDILTWAMQWFGGDPGVPVIVGGKETFPLIPVAIGLYSTFFNIFNAALLFPFLGVFERILMKVGATATNEEEDYTQPMYLTAAAASDPATAVPAVQRETGRYLEAARKFLDIAKGTPNAPDKIEEHYAAIDILNREIRSYTSGMFKADMPYARADLVASLIEEEDQTASLGETLYQIARRIERQPFGEIGRGLVDTVVDQVADALRAIIPIDQVNPPVTADAEPRLKGLLELRERCLRLGAELPWVERGAILALLGSAERAFYLIERIDSERKSVSRSVPATAATGEQARNAGGFGAAVPA